MEEIKRCAGNQFDPALAKVFVTLDFEPYRQSVAELNAGQATVGMALLAPEESSHEHQVRGL